MKILRLETSIRGTASNSYQLGNAIVEKLKKQHPRSQIISRNLVKNEIPHLNEIHFASFSTSKESLSAELKSALEISDNAIAELKQSNSIVIDVPMYNFSIPSSLKAWIDHITRAGVTFRYTPNGAEGLVKNKRVYLAIASGGVYVTEAMKEVDFTERYLRKALGFIGMNDITAFRVEGVGIPGIKEQAMSRAIRCVEKAFKPVNKPVSSP